MRKDIGKIWGCFADPMGHPYTQEPRRGRCGLAVRSLPRGRKAPGSKPDSNEDPPCMLAYCTLNHAAAINIGQASFR
ncbi:hypothetical protein AVEN_262986-1 [Araneus ventricosus]|uniref:Uncharacterized protein n=1 Tax=Araneus ventricosus TaxID=182803 RepID=A0A4Y2W9U5_ARAVE|nr:hypothetical protein AVEN_262986-1 [Araneus ventricosus]